jgi:hypothetical protein
MGWLDKILGKLVDINLNLESEQTGVLNIKTEKNTYNNPLIFATPEAARAYAEVVVAGNQTKLIENAEKILSANSTTLKVLPESTAVQFANATIVASAAAASGVEGKVKMTEGNSVLKEKLLLRFRRNPQSQRGKSPHAGLFWLLFQPAHALVLMKNIAWWGTKPCH